MTKEELKKESEDFLQKKCGTSEMLILGGDAREVLADFAEPREKRIAELEKEISVLLSCKNCPENKGGLICAKEYNDKCLAQKIQYIKELKEENAELKTDYEVLSCSVGDFGELQDKLEEEQRKNNELSDNLTKAKEIIKDLLSLCEGETDSKLVFARAEQFLNCSEKPNN